MQVGVTMKVSWVGHTFALTPRCSDAPVKKTRNRCSREDRKTMVQSFINKYQNSNDGSFPSLSLTHREVGGSFYTVREIVREIIQENKVLAPGNPNSQVLHLEDYVESDSVPHSSLHLSLPVLDSYPIEAIVNEANDGIVDDDHQIDELEDVITTTSLGETHHSLEGSRSLEASQTPIEVSSDSLSQVYECVFENVEGTEGAVTYSTEILTLVEEVYDRVSDKMEDLSSSSRLSDDLRNSSEASLIISEDYSEKKSVDAVVLDLDSFTNEIDSERNADLNNMIPDLGQLSPTSHGGTSEISKCEVPSDDMQAEEIKPKLSNIIHEPGPVGINSESKYKAQPNHLIDNSETANPSLDGVNSESSKDAARKHEETSETNPIVYAIKGFFAGLVKLFIE